MISEHRRSWVTAEQNIMENTRQSKAAHCVVSGRLRKVGM